MVNSSLHIPWMFVSRGVRLSSLKCIAVAAAIQRPDERYICMNKLTRALLVAGIIVAVSLSE